MHVCIPVMILVLLDLRLTWILRKVKIHSPGLIKSLVLRMNVELPNEDIFFSFAECALHYMTRQDSLLMKAAATVTKTS